VARPEDAAVPRRARELLAALAERYALVACLSGRQATDARRLVGLESISYVGNHGLELLGPGRSDVETPVALSDQARLGRSFARAELPALEPLGVAIEDKDAIQAFHWRGAPDPGAAERALKSVARRAAAEGLVPHWGRMVLEIRPPLDVDKGTAIAAALAGRPIDRALYAGDDTTDLDAFRKVHELRDAGRLAHAVCVGIASSEGPAQIVAEADLVAEGTEGFLDLLELLG
jgi:trehalose 6-phosphate phosphatase